MYSYSNTISTSFTHLFVATKEQDYTIEQNKKITIKQNKFTHTPGAELFIRAN